MSLADDKAVMGEQITLIGRWHDVAHSKGIAIFECDNTEAISNWAFNWNTALDVEISRVLDDEEIRALGKKRFA